MHFFLKTFSVVGFLLLLSSGSSFLLGTDNGRSLSFLSTGSKVSGRIVSTPLHMTAVVPTLNEDTTWKFRLFLTGLKSSDGKDIGDQIFNLKARFQEDVGYEPPQGTVEQIFTDDDSEDEKQLKIKFARWTLSEDPDDRKDGLWVWGLFKEPLYPYLLLTVETEALVLETESEVVLPSSTFFAKIPHRRNDGAVELENTEIFLRSFEKLQLVGAVAEYTEDMAIGQLQITPSSLKARIV